MGRNPVIPAKKQPKQQRAKALVESILEAAARILEDGGLDKLTTNRIAEMAGVSVGSLYQYFPNKQSIFDELVTRYDREFQERMVNTFAKLPPLSLSQGLREFVRFSIDIHKERPKLHNILAAEIPEYEHQFLLSATRTGLEARRAELRREDLEIATYIVVEIGESLIHGTALRAPELLDDPRFLDEVCDVMERYLLK